MIKVFVPGTVSSILPHRSLLAGKASESVNAPDGLPRLTPEGDWVCSIEVSKRLAKQLTSSGTASIAMPEMFAWQTSQETSWALKLEGSAGATMTVWQNGGRFREPSSGDPIADVERRVLARTADKTSNVVVERCRLFPGQCFYRMWRGEASPTAYLAGVRSKLVQANTVRRMLERRMRELFEFVHPQGQLKVFSHRARELIMLACTEVESGLKAILLANGAVDPDNWKMSHYAHLSAPLALETYAVELTSFPDFCLFAPFDHWGRGAKNPDWYAAYNKTKHNREAALDKATVGNAIDAVAACFILLHAQFGPDPLLSADGWDEFRIVQGPFIAPGDRYIPHDLDCPGGLPLGQRSLQQHPELIGAFTPKAKQPAPTQGKKRGKK